MKLSGFCFLFIFLNISFFGFSQAVKPFSTDPTKFIVELKTFFEDQDNKDEKKEAKDFMEAFTLSWTTGKFTDNHKKQIIATSNLMLKKKMKALPHFKNYLSTFQSFITTNQSEKSFASWQASLEKLINRPTSTQFTSFINISYLLVSQNILYKSNTTEWKSSSKEFTFEYDSVPRIVFPASNLVCYACKDSANIYNTNGIYYPITNEWVGKGGKVTWKRAGFDENNVYAELDKYKIILKQYKYTADSVKFYHKGYFSTFLLGKLSEKVMPDVTTEKAQFPQFESYSKRFKIPNIFENIDYEGGFSMHGASLIGTGDKQKDAYLFFYRDKKKFVTTSSKTYSIRKDKITSQRAAVTIYWDKDSIYHPGLQFKYLNETKDLVLFREDNGVANTPFHDSFHKLDFYIEGLYWKTNEPKIDFKMVKGVGTESEAFFESYDYFSGYRYDQLQGIDNIHPLVIIRDLSLKLKRKTITVNEFAKYMGVGQEIAEAQAIRMATKGFLLYDEDDKMFIITEKINQFLSAKVHKVDYDALQFNSAISGKPNASISLLNFDMTIRGVKQILLSDTQKVYVYPKGQEIIVKKNRDFTFEGRVHAGLFDFYGKQCSFEYDKFKLNLPMTDSLSFKVHSFKADINGEFPLVKVKTVIENLNGEIFIDHQKNKSGFYPFGQFPSFVSKKESYVYYDRKSIINGIYNRSKFYYHVDPFKLDSLDNFKTDNLKLNGYLVSGGIFPDIVEPLRVQPDYSLGFVRSTGESGLQAYGGKGTFNNQIKLSNQGFQGNGTLTYLTSVSKSNNFMFFPDSMNANAYSYDLKEQIGAVEYPNVKGEDVIEHWAPYKNEMVIKKDKKSIAMYDLKSKMNGALTLTPKGLTGNGTMEFNDAEMDSKNFKFKQHIFDADTSDFRLKSYDLTQLAFRTLNYKGHVDFKERKGEFKSNGGSSKVEFPVNEYICFMDEFDWFMDKSEIELANNTNKQPAGIENMTLKELADIDISGSEFISTNAAQDSLRFFSPRAKYNLKDNIIYCQDVKFIKVADAAIFPSKGKVTILKKAEMKPLDNAQILANTTTKYHTMYNAIVNILSKKNYNAVANYDYIDETGKKEQINFSKVAVDTTTQTYAIGTITDSTAFSLSSEFAYVGNINLTARNEFLNFDGAFKIKNDCDTIKPSWIKFISDINPNEIYIPISTTLKDINNKNLSAGILFSNDTNQVYSAFLRSKFKATDVELVSANGFISFDKITKEFRISTKEKLKQINQPGNYLSLNRSKCMTYGEGKIDIASNIGQVKIAAYGNVRHYIIPDSASMNLVMAIDFFFNDDALKLISQSLEKNTSLPAADLSSETYTKSLAEILGVEKADKFISEMSLGSFKHYPSELVHTFFLTGLQFKWNKSTKSYVAEGQIGICNINKTQINKSVYGIVEIVKKKSGDVINIYLQPDKFEWYFFSYSNKIMSGISSNNEFAKYITDTKPDNRQMKVENGPAYSYYTCTEATMKKFLKKFKPVNE